MRTLNVKNLSILTAAAGLALTLMSGTSHAGFQYVPPSQETPSSMPGAPDQPEIDSSVMTPAPTTPVSAQPISEPSFDPVTPTPAAQQVSVEPKQDIHVLTIPAGKSAPAPVQAAAPQAQQPRALIKTITVSPTPAPAPQPVAEQSKPEATTASETAKEITWNPAPAHAPAPASQAVPIPVPVTAEAAPAPEELPQVEAEVQTPALAPLETSKVEPTKVETKVIMPQDAPVKAVEATPNGKLIINPFPASKEEQPAQQTAQAPAEIQTESFAAAEPAPEALAQIAPAAGDESVVGFGSDMPLALALQEIAPPSYTFSYEPSVNPGVRVSWDGQGKSWEQVVSGMIEPLNLQASVKGNVVHISQQAGQTTNAAPIAASPASAPAALEEAIPLQQGAEAAPETQASEKPLKISNASLRRNAIRDPGEAEQVQPLVNVEPASGGAEEQQPDAVTTKLAQEAAPEEIKPLLEAEAQPARTPEAGATQPSVQAKNIWQVNQGDSLKEILGEWSKQANIDFVWKASHDYTVDTAFTVTDSFQNAVEMLISHGVKVSPRPEVQFQASAPEGKSGTLLVQDRT